MSSAAKELVELAGRKDLVVLGALAVIGAATEGLGVVLLVPLLILLSGETRFTQLPFELTQVPLAILLAIYVVLVAVRAGTEIARALLAQRVTVSIVDGLRRRALAALFGADWRFLSGQAQSRNRAMIVTSIDRVGEAVQHLTSLLRAGVTLVALAIAGLTLSPMFTLGMVLTGIAALALLRWLRRDARRIGEALVQRYEGIYRRLEEGLAALRLAKIHARGRREVDGTALEFEAMRQVERRYILTTMAARSAIQIGAAVLLAIAVWFAMEGFSASSAILLAFVALAVRAIPLVESIQGAAQGWNHAAPALEQSLALIGEAEKNAEPMQTGPVDTPRLHRSVELQNVHFVHSDGRIALMDVSLNIPRGQIAALTGPSGAGKSTVADLAAGLVSPDRGAVLIDGVPLEGGARQAWRSRVAYVQQDAVLFSGSVRDNLCWAEPEADEHQICEALRRASADFVHELPGGIDCQIGEAGRSLSGGERQRIALARALLREPDLLILDEATSAVDPGSEEKIAQAVAGLEGKCTVLVIGHRGRLAEMASLRFALENGRLKPS